MSPLFCALVASALVEGSGTAVALEDGTVWMAYDGEWEELGACDDGAVVALSADGGVLEIICEDTTAWTWTDALGWQAAPAYVSPTATAWTDAPRVAAPWWPTLEVSARVRDTTGEPIYEGWVRLRWNL